MSRGIHFSLGRLAACVVLLAQALPAWSSSQTFNLTGRVADLYIGQQLSPVDPGLLLTGGSIPLAGVGTGQTQFPGYSLAVGDQLIGRISLDGAASVPADNALDSFGALLGWMVVPTESVFFQGTVGIFDHGVQIVPASGYYTFSGSGGALMIGVGSVTVPFLGFSFDAIEFDMTVTGLRDGQTPVDSVAMQPGGYSVFFQTSTPIPEPTAPLLMLGGLAALFAVRRGADVKRALGRALGRANP